MITGKVLHVKYQLWLSIRFIGTGQQWISSVSLQFSSVAQSCPTLCDPMNRNTPGLPVHHPLPKFAQTYVHRVNLILDILQN